MSIKLEMLRVFRTVAETGTLAAAARALNRTPSAISMTLAQLESDIGAPLFETDRKSRLTPLGRLVLEESSRATETFDKSTLAIRRHALSSAGIVRVAAVPSATVSLIPDVIALFRKTHAKVRIEISDVDTGAVRRRVQRDEADIGIISARKGEVSHGEVIACDDLGIVCKEGGAVHQAHLAQGGASDWDVLLREPLIANPLCRLVGEPMIDAAMTASTLEARNTTAILSFVRRGFGVSILPYEAVQSQPEGVEFFVPAKATVVQRELRKIRQENETLRGFVQAFWILLDVRNG
ncbi:DNA-binding transcriptional regulator, LysR family [Loktanella sp. DSM 29012]|uniref:LysR family transcriptional regulator n=1 Tax=Loktanella sp. DSM 29012 TaxID=1881056 RepID=UPI0008D3D182|nr:LysR family transcriptional regulator [Loktanella sp. DSM 29012]SEQ83279.1 DNA-binding transcriptional regulator, LysR family [Loktanella sp. DSM 29012]